MKTILLLLLSGIAYNQTNAQCQKKILYTSSKVEFLDNGGNVKHTEEGKYTIELTKEDVVMNHNDLESDRLTGKVKELSCNWAVPFKTGLTTFKTELFDKGGDSKDAVMEIEGNEDHIIIFLTLNGKRIKIYIDKCEEVL